MSSAFIDLIDLIDPADK